MSNTADASGNRLSQETSPYLLQHADNPVYWWPWCDEALQLARDENKPILLSIGYSACHWCHVMAHESFEDQATADVMNSLFINIKVDREERPDLDKIYQTAHQLLNQRAGGWPLTAILTPDDHTPFFMGTYFPKTNNHGLPAFINVLQQVAKYFHEHHEEIQKQNHSLLAALSQTLATAMTSANKLSDAPLRQAQQQLLDNYDQEYAGFGTAPKFPHPSSIEFLLRHGFTRGNTESSASLDAAHHTLQAMAAGGIYDQLGGGFCRYSVDDMWMIPHFEKMLYDNGPLLSLYADTAIAFNDTNFRRITTETANWVMREMQSAEGGYYSTLDADSEGEEGKFYVWTPDEIKSLLNQDEYRIIAKVFGLDRGANFEGQWHLHTYNNLDKGADKLHININQAESLFSSAKQKLYTTRCQRIWPGKDEKILTSWNALMIKGMATAGRRLQQKEFIDSAERAVNFIRDNLFVNGRLLASYKDGQARLTAYLDDYAFLIDALLELLQARWKNADLGFAIELAECLLTHFEDEPHGGFYFTANDHENLYHRPKPMSDESTPAGNGIAAYALQRLGYLLGEPRYLQAAEKTLCTAWQHIQHMPYAHCSLLIALEEYLHPPKTIIIRGNAAEIIQWQQHLQRQYQPRQMSFAIPRESSDLHAALASKPAQESALAYICEGLQCSPPVDDIEQLL